MFSTVVIGTILSDTSTRTWRRGSAIVLPAREVPTLKGVLRKPPSQMNCEVTSEQQQAVGPLLAEVKQLLHDVGLVYVSEQRL